MNDDVDLPFGEGARRRTATRRPRATPRRVERRAAPGVRAPSPARRKRAELLARPLDLAGEERHLVVVDAAAALLQHLEGGELDLERTAVPTPSWHAPAST